MARQSRTASRSVAASASYNRKGHPESRSAGYKPHASTWRDADPGRTFTASERVRASKGAKPRYEVAFLASCDPEVRAKIEAKLREIDAHPHKDPKPRDPEAVQRALRTVTEAQRVAAEARLVAAMAKGAEIRMVPWDPRPVAEECGCRADDSPGPHVPMADGRCALCDRPLEVEAASEVAPEPEPAPVISLPRPEPKPEPVAPYRGAGAWSMRRAA